METQHEQDYIESESDKALILEVKQWPVVYDKKSKMIEEISESEAWTIIGAKLQKSSMLLKSKLLIHFFFCIVTIKSVSLFTIFSADICQKRFKRMREKLFGERKRREQNEIRQFKEYELMKFMDSFIKKR